MDQAVIAELARTGTLRAGVNMGNFLLVTGTNGTGDPKGVAPDLARAIAKRLGVPLDFRPFSMASEVAEAAAAGACDIGLIGADPAHAETMIFTAPCVLIEATYLVLAGSPLETVADTDRLGARIAVASLRPGLLSDAAAFPRTMGSRRTLLRRAAGCRDGVRHLGRCSVSPIVRGQTRKALVWSPG